MRDLIDHVAGFDELPVLAEEQYDASDPTQDTHLRKIAETRHVIANFCVDLAPDHIFIAKQHHIGTPTAEIAQKVQLTPTTVRNVLKRPKIRRLSALLGYLSLIEAGVTETQQVGMLWDIAVQNKEADPRVAISANSEISKMRHQKAQIEAGLANGGSNEIKIIIDTNTMPRTALDG